MRAPTVSLQSSKTSVEGCSSKLGDRVATMAIENTEQSRSLLSSVVGNCRALWLLGDGGVRRGSGSSRRQIQVDSVRVLHSCHQITDPKSDVLMRHPCMSDNPTQNCPSRTTTVVCFSVTAPCQRPAAHRLVGVTNQARKEFDPVNSVSKRATWRAHAPGNVCRSRQLIPNSP
jgi:hypothetical protein